MQPRLFGKYEILSSIGRGGMATVYRACLHGPAGAARPVALKVIHPELGREQLFVKLFLAETRVAMALNHRNIVQTFDAGEQDGQYFMAMELVNGCSLHELLKKRANLGLPVDIALFIAVELCSALHYAHEFHADLRGQPESVVHCDVSPSNILLGRDGEVKLADFGVARARDKMTQTSLDLVKGKLNYMAPEQARGRAQVRSDLFSVGVVLHEMLAGRTLRRLTDLAEVLQGPIEIPALPRPELPPELMPIIRACLSKSPEGRPESGLALRKLLADLLFQTQVQGRTGGDSHARLGAFLEQMLADDVTAAPNPVAQLLVAEVQGLSSVTGPAAEQSPAPEDAGRSAKVTAPTAVERPRAAARVAAQTDPPRQPHATAPTTLERPRGRADHARAGEPESASASPVSAAEDELPLRPAHSTIWMYVLLAVLALGLTVAGVLLLRSRTTGSASQAVAHVDAARAAVRAEEQEPAHDRGSGFDRAPVGVVRKPNAPRPAPRPIGTGELQLNSFPWAKVFVDGRYVGDTPVEGLKLSAGVHKIRLHNPERRLEKVMKIPIRAGRSTSRVVNLLRAE